VSPPISDGMVVTINYALRNPAGELLDRSDDGEPLSYLQGAGNIVPGLERELDGKQVGDKLRAVIAPTDGYGERTGPQPQSISREQFPDDADLEEGMQVLAHGPGGEQFPLWVVGIDDESVTLDHNHPLAGETLHFDVEVMAVRAATEEEQAHGHPHGLDDHHH
jgi:FKBP-type peptidyl-prolyl cis-trans isomerase SlyD